MHLRCLAILLLWPICSIHAQPKVGEPVPSIEFRLINRPNSALKLEQLRGKFVILDFWATWCTACIQKFPLMDSLQQQYRDRLQVILVNTIHTGDDSLKIASFQKQWEKRQARKLGLRIAVQDSVADRFFPHSMLPHYVWISPAGTFLGASNSRMVNAATIGALLSGQDIAFDQKVDMDTDRPLFSDPARGSVATQSYSILVKGYYNGLPSGMRTRISGDVAHGIAIYNMSLSDVFGMVLARLDRGVKPKVKLEMPDSTDFVAPSGDDRELWFDTHARTVDFIVPVERSKDLYKDLLFFLNNNSGYEASKEGEGWIIRGKTQSDR